MRLALVPLVAVLLAAGCGGSRSNARLSHADFVKKANAICADYNSKTAKLGTPNSYDAIAAYARKLQQLAEDSVGKFKQLNPPADERANWKAYAKSGDELIAAAKQLEQAGKKKDTAALTRILNESRARSAESHRIAAAMGAADCTKT